MDPNERMEQWQGCLDKMVRWPLILACVAALAWVAWSMVG